MSAHDKHEYVPGIFAPENCPLCRVENLERQLVEERAERARHKAALAGALHVSGASEDTLVEFVVRLYACAAESEAQCARMREALAPFAECAMRMPGEVGPPLNVDIVSVRTGEYIVSTSAHTFRCAADAISSTAGADLLREVAALRELEKAALERHGRNCWLPGGCQVCKALSAVAESRRKP